MRTGGVEPPQPEALALQAGELANAQRPREVAGRTRTGVAGTTTRSIRLYTTATAGTAGLEPAASRLTSERSGRLSYAPNESRAGGIRTHGLELMRLARTTAPLPRSGLAGRTRTCDPRLPGPVGWPAPPQPDDDRRGRARGHRLDVDAGGRPGSTSSPSPSRDRSRPLTARSTSTRASIVQHPRRDSKRADFRVEGPASSPLRPRGRARLRRQGSNLRSRG
jgi:hypothetical protein